MTTPHLDNITQMGTHLLRQVYLRCIRHEQGISAGWTGQQEDAALAHYADALDRDSDMLRRLIVQAVGQVSMDELSQEVDHG